MAKSKTNKATSKSRPKPMSRKPGLSKGRPYGCGGKLK